jgi:hypothetical protein
MTLLRYSLVASFMIGVLAVAQEKKKVEAPTPPQPLYPIPIAIDKGKTSRITVRGRGMDIVTLVKPDDPKVSAKIVKARKAGVPNQYAPERIGDSEVEVEITLPADWTKETVGLIFHNGKVDSKPYEMPVHSGISRRNEKEPNEGFKEAMLLQVPEAIDAKISKSQDVDVYRVDAAAGQMYVFEVQARRWGSPVEAMMTLYDDSGRSVATGEINPKQPDPIIRFEAPRKGSYYLSVIDANDQGDSTFVYRLIVKHVVK